MADFRQYHGAMKTIAHDLNRLDIVRREFENLRSKRVMDIEQIGDAMAQLVAGIESGIEHALDELHERYGEAERVVDAEREQTALANWKGEQAEKVEG